MQANWNLKQLKDAMTADLAMCHSAFERSMCKVICESEIRKRAHEIAALRKLTPGEMAIAEDAGYPRT